MPAATQRSASPFIALAVSARIGTRSPRVVSAAPKLGLALGYDVSAALESPGAVLD